MSMSYNKAIYIGYLVRKPEMKYTPAGTPVTKATLAVNQTYKDKEIVLFMDFVVFGKAAETLEKWGDKGSPMLIEGETRSENWEHEGKKYYKTYTFCKTFRFLGKKSDEPENTISGDDEEIPF